MHDTTLHARNRLLRPCDLMHAELKAELEAHTGAYLAEHDSLRRADSLLLDNPDLPQAQAYAYAVARYHLALDMQVAETAKRNRAHGLYKRLYGRADIKEAAARQKAETAQARMLAASHMVQQARQQMMEAATQLVRYYRPLKRAS